MFEECFKHGNTLQHHTISVNMQDNYVYSFSSSSYDNTGHCEGIENKLSVSTCKHSITTSKHSIHL